jgi:hypothetical protein
MDFSLNQEVFGIMVENEEQEPRSQVWKNNNKKEMTRREPWLWIGSTIKGLPQ